MSLEILCQMIHADAKEPITRNYRNHSVTLREPQQPDSTVEIHGLPHDAIIIKLDKFPDPGHFFNKERGECRRADYAIVTDTNGSKRLLVIEIKRENDQHNFLTQQFRGARCVLAYCEEVARQFYDCGDLFQGFEFRYIAFCRTCSRLRKQKTRPPMTGKRHDKPHLFMKIENPNHIQYNHLVGA